MVSDQLKKKWKEKGTETNKKNCENGGQEGVKQQVKTEQSQEKWEERQRDFRKGGMNVKKKDRQYSNPSIKVPRRQRTATQVKFLLSKCYSSKSKQVPAGERTQVSKAKVLYLFFTVFTEFMPQSQD